MAKVEVSNDKFEMDDDERVLVHATCASQFMLDAVHGKPTPTKRWARGVLMMATRLAYRLGVQHHEFMDAAHDEWTRIKWADNAAARVELEHAPNASCHPHPPTICAFCSNTKGSFACQSSHG